MLRYLGCCLLWMVCIAGCSPAKPMPNYAKYNLDDGRYLVEIEDTQGGASLNYHSHSEGRDVTAETFDLAWGKSHRLQIVDGQLTIDGAERGKLEPGDKILIHASGEVLLNGKKL